MNLSEMAFGVAGAAMARTAETFRAPAAHLPSAAHAAWAVAASARAVASAVLAAAASARASSPAASRALSMPPRNIEYVSGWP